MAGSIVQLKNNYHQSSKHSVIDKYYNYQITADLIEFRREEMNFRALTELLRYDFENKEEIGKHLDRYNGATCVDIRKERSTKFVKSPINHLILLHQMTKEICKRPSFGLKMGETRKKNYIHFLYECDKDTTTGICFYDQKRPLTVKQIHDGEKSLQSTGINRNIIVANKIGIPAKNEAERINSEYDAPIIILEHFDSLKKRYMQNF